MHKPTARFMLSLLAVFSAAAITATPLPVWADTIDEVAADAEISPSALWEQQFLQMVSPYQALPNSHAEYEDRYLAWGQAHPEYTPEQVVLDVNIGLDRAFYTDTVITSQPESLSVLVNKYIALPSDYIPQLETLGSTYGTGSLRPEAAAAFRAMADAARAEGISLRSVSAYRSYQVQDRVYSRYLTQDTQASVDSYSARPGFSEHQTALALDINTASLQSHFETTPAYAWLTQHCAQYGFILRYPQGKESVTGYQFEPWHYRYVGVEIAQVCMSGNLTLEEYLALQPVEKAPVWTGPVEGLPFI